MPEVGVGIRRLMVGLGFLFLFMLPAIGYGDQVPWGPVTGRTNAVGVKRSQFGDVTATLSLNMLLPDSKRVTDAAAGANVAALVFSVPVDNPVPAQVAGNCVNSWDPTCNGLSQVNSCDWAALTSAARAALTLVLGSCVKSCFVSLSTAVNGESVTFFSWSCQQANTAQCVTMAGTLTPGLRIDLLRRDSGCQF